jgi:4-hydroxy-tetrahydrodipicolinate synthase
MAAHLFRGSMPALITPFLGGAVDDARLAKLVDRQVLAGSHGVVPAGTTGESATLSHAEHDRVIQITVDTVAKRVPVIAGCGSNATDEALRLIRYAAKAGADAALVVTPYYNKPSQQGMYLHFKTLSEASDLPIFIYNIPGRSVVDMSPDTMGRLAELKNIIGVKDATGNLIRVAQQRATCGADFIQMSGNDELALGFNAMGGVGCISVTANIAPELCAQYQEAILRGDPAAALQFQDRLTPLHLAVFTDNSPAPTKYAMKKLGILDSDETRLPIAPASDASRAAVDAALRHAGLLN